MNIYKPKYFFIFLLMLLPMVLSGCSSLPQFTAEKNKGRIVIDGDKGDWRDLSAYINKSNTYAVSVSYDTEYVYFCLTSPDVQTQMHMMRGGLTVWFDKKGSDHKTFGINFPLGRKELDAASARNREGMWDPEEGRKLIEQSLFELEVVGEKESDRYKLGTVNNEGIVAKIKKSDNNVLVYELRVPLKKTQDHPHAIEDTDGSAIGVGVEFGVLNRPARKKQSERTDISVGSDGNESPTGEEGEMGLEGGRRFGGGRGQHGPRPDAGVRKEDVDMWWKVKLGS